MKVQVICGTRLGATRQIADRIAHRLGRPGSTPAPWRRRSSPANPAADAYVLGSGVYAGHWQKAIASFARDKAVDAPSAAGLAVQFGTGGRRRGRAEPTEPREVGQLRRLLDARDHRVFAGALDRDTVDGSDLNRLERVPSRAGSFPEGDWRDWDSIDRWADQIASSLLGPSIARPSRS